MRVVNDDDYGGNCGPATLGSDWSRRDGGGDEDAVASEDRPAVDDQTRRSAHRVRRQERAESGNSKTFIYDEINAGRLPTVQFGRRPRQAPRPRHPLPMLARPANIGLSDSRSVYSRERVARSAISSAT